MNLERRIERLEEKEDRQFERISELKESLATLTNELNHVAHSLKDANRNTREIATSLGKMKMLIYVLIIVGSITVIPELKAAVPLLMKMVM